MHALFVACLFGGAVSTVLLAALGRVAGHGHAGGHGHLHGSHASHHGHAGREGARPLAAHHGHAVISTSAGWVLSWFSPLTVAAGALWFGGAGLLTEGAGGAVAFPAAVVAALVGAVIVRTAMNAFLRAGTAPLQAGAEGAIGTVNATIRPDAAGEVVYTLEGLHRSLPARSEDGTTIPRGAQVVIVRRERGFAWVVPLDPLDRGSAPDLLMERGGT